MINSCELIQRLSIRLSPMLVLCLLLAVGVGCSKKEAPPPPPPEVQVAAVVQKTCRFTSSLSAPRWARRT
jgi:hypothetical protein